MSKCTSLFSPCGGLLFILEPVRLSLPEIGSGPMGKTWAAVTYAYVRTHTHSLVHTRGKKGPQVLMLSLENGGEDRQPPCPAVSWRGCPGEARP